MNFSDNPFSKRVAIHCPVCSAEISQHNRNLRCGNYIYKVCCFCKSYILDPLPAPAQTEKIYRNPSYFEEVYGDYFTSISGHKNFLNWFRYVVKYLPDRNSRIAEIGSGSGVFLQVLQQFGYTDIRGYELNEFAVDICKAKELPVYQQESFILENNLDAVFMFDVIEHIPNPNELLQQIYNRLRPGGLLVIETSCNRRLVARLMGRLWWFLIPPNHVIIYNINSLERLLSAHNFRMLESIKINYHWLSLKNALVKVKNLFPFRWSIEGLIRKDIVFPFVHLTSFLSIARK